MAKSSKKMVASAENMAAPIDRLQHTLDLSRGALKGPDPWASLGYLKLLKGHVESVLATYRRPA